VLDVLKAYEMASGREIAYKIVPRRDGILLETMQTQGMQRRF